VQFQNFQTTFGTSYRRVAFGGLATLPAWARFFIFLLTIPGILLLALSLLMVGVSILALLLPTVPVYLLLKRVLGPKASGTAEYGSPGSKRVEAVVKDA
jgi:hypothetical protein